MAPTIPVGQIIGAFVMKDHTWINYREYMGAFVIKDHPWINYREYNNYTNNLSQIQKLVGMLY